MVTKSIWMWIFWLIALIAYAAKEQPAHHETPMDIFTQQAQPAADSYPYDLDVCAVDDPTE
jgi:hypothetical protein